MVMPVSKLDMFDEMQMEMIPLIHQLQMWMEAYQERRVKPRDQSTVEQFNRESERLYQRIRETFNQ